MTHHRTCIVLITTMVSFATSTSTAHAGLIAWWDFNSAAGSNVTDVSGNGLTGVMSGTAALSADALGHSGASGDKALDLTGNNAAQDRMTVSAAQFTPHNPGTNSFSVSFWVKPTVLGGAADHAGIDGYDITLSNGKIDLVLGDGGANNGTDWEVPGTTTVDVDADNTWQLVALVVDRTAGEFTVYVDGVAETAFTFAWNDGGAWTPNLIPAGVDSIDLNASDLKIGEKNGNTGLVALLDDYAIYDTALTAQQVSNLFDRSGSPDNLDAIVIPVPAALPAGIVLIGLAAARRHRVQ